MALTLVSIRVLLLSSVLEIGLPCVAMNRPVSGRVPAAFGESFEFVHVVSQLYQLGAM